MNRQDLNYVAQHYLSRYHGILAEMIREMTDAELTDSISHNFIVQMIPHHRAAIEMCENILQYLNLTSVHWIAERIVAEQTKSIEALEEAAKHCDMTVNCENDVIAYQTRAWQIMQLMFCEMHCAYADNYISCDFMREMIPHHIGAVRMSENALQYCICPELTPILENIITSQKRGIHQMSLLLKEYGCAVGKIIV